MMKLDRFIICTSSEKYRFAINRASHHFFNLYHCFKLSYSISNCNVCNDAGLHNIIAMLLTYYNQRFIPLPMALGKYFPSNTYVTSCPTSVRSKPVLIKADCLVFGSVQALNVLHSNSLLYFTKNLHFSLHYIAATLLE